MVGHIDNYSELWVNIPWRKLRKNLFRLQCRLWKAIREGDKKRANSLQKLILKSRSARLLAIRQVTQLNTGKKTAGVDGKASLSFRERFELDTLLRQKVNTWTHSKLRKIAIPKKDGTKRILKVPTVCPYCTSIQGSFGQEAGGRGQGAGGLQEAEGKGALCMGDSVVQQRTPHRKSLRRGKGERVKS